MNPWEWKPKSPKTACWLSGEKDQLARKIRSLSDKYTYAPTANDVSTAFGQRSDWRDVEHLEAVLNHNPDLFYFDGHGWSLTDKARRMIKG